MEKLIYKKMSLFNAPEGSVLVHACNCKGVWGSGIAKEFKERFPAAERIYKETCDSFGIIGTAQLISSYDVKQNSSNYWIGNLLTSRGFGSTLDTEDEILVNTVLALWNLCSNLQSKNINTVYSNKFNSGLFKVPWEKTEAIIKVFANRYDLTWVICDPNLD